MEDLISYTTSALGYSNHDEKHAKPPLSPSSSVETFDETFVEESIEAYSAPLSPRSPISTMDIQVITCVSYRSHHHDSEGKDYVFKPNGPSTPQLDEVDSQEVKSCFSDIDFDCVSEQTAEEEDEDLFGLQFLDLCGGIDMLDEDTKEHDVQDTATDANTESDNRMQKEDGIKKLPEDKVSRDGPRRTRQVSKLPAGFF